MLCPESPDPINGRIFRIRGHRVILDADLARLYDVPTFRLNRIHAVGRISTLKIRNHLVVRVGSLLAGASQSASKLAGPRPTASLRLNEAVKRNLAKFPQDFRFQLTKEELVHLISQIAISSSGHGGVRKLPWVFTEHGALMAANVLRSPRATKMAIYVVRAFIKQRETIATNTVVLKRVAEVDKTLLEHDTALQVLWTRLQPLLAPPPIRPRRRIGFHPDGK